MIGIFKITNIHTKVGASTERSYPSFRRLGPAKE